MTRRRLACLLSLGLTLLLAPPTAAAPSPDLTGELLERDGVPLLRLWGTPRERGFAHGYLLAEEIVQGADRSLDVFLGEHREFYAQRMLPVAKMAFRFAADEKAELEGMLAGIEARLPDPEDRTLHCLDRVAGYDDLLVVNVFGDIHALGCSSLAIWGELTADGHAAVARNFDFPALDLLVGRQHVRVVAPHAEGEGSTTRHGYVGIGHPGGIGILTGLSREGVFAAIHDVHVTPALKDLPQGNVPRLIAIRRLLEQLDAKGAVEEAARLCRGWNTLYGNNIMVATSDPGEGLAAGVLEYDTNETDDQGVDLRGPEASMLYVCCTNHHRTRGNGTCARFDGLSDEFDDGEREPVAVKQLFSTIESTSFPVAGETLASGGFGTLHQVVAETGKRRLHVRFASVGENIRNVAPRAFQVTQEVDALPGAD